MKKKSLIVLLLILAFTLPQCIKAFATTDIVQPLGAYVPITPLWTNVNNITLGLSFNSGQATCTGVIRGITGTTKINATFYLERSSSYGWTLVKSWSVSSMSSTLSFSDNCAVTSGVYQLRVVADVTANGLTEQVSTSYQNMY
ncbi:MAG: hypothetical protein FWC47_02660 [Oscillospiraceae bacterium]|nr:hypothetical protein [Oscillospiraceae bacterium]